MIKKVTISLDEDDIEILNKFDNIGYDSRLGCRLKEFFKKYTRMNSLQNDVLTYKLPQGHVLNAYLDKNESPFPFYGPTYIYIKKQYNFTLSKYVYGISTDMPYVTHGSCQFTKIEIQNNNGIIHDNLSSIMIEDF